MQMQEQDVDDGGGRTTQQQEKSIDDWLPINSSRKAKWWYSAFHNVTAMVGAGVLGLPYAMSELGWYVYFMSRILNPASDDDRFDLNTS
jgi:hypothetical protein